MNDFELETELKKMRPHAASSELIARIEGSLAEPADAAAEVSGRMVTAGVLPKRRRSHVHWLGLGLGLTAAAAFLLLARIETGHLIRKPHLAAVTPSPLMAPMVPVDTFLSTGVTQVVYSRHDEGLHFPDGADQPVRRVRAQKRETLQWNNPITRTSLRISYPSEEVTLIPVSGQ